jgi:hypothetical protein
MMKPLMSPKFLIVSIVILLTSVLVLFVNVKLWAEAEKKRDKIKQLYGVNIHYEYVPKSFFPRHPSARGSQARVKNIPSTLSLVEEFLSKYPKEVISRNLTHLFILGTLEFFGKRYGGTYIDSAIYVSTGGFLKYSDSSLLGLMHAEFSSILLQNYEFPSKEWEAINKPTWRYFGSGFEMLGRMDQYHQIDELLENGFLDGYSQASLEEDVNIFVDWIFTKPERLQKLTAKYERIQKKHQLVMKFYKSIDPRIDVPTFGWENVSMKRNLGYDDPRSARIGFLNGDPG